MIVYLGMSGKLPNLCYHSNEEYSFSRPYGKETTELIDKEMKRMVSEQCERTRKVLSEHMKRRNKLAWLLIDKEVISAKDVEHIFGRHSWTSHSEEIMVAKGSQDATKAERKLAGKLKAEEQEIEKEGAKNSVQEEVTTETKIIAEGKRVTIEGKVTTEAKSNEKKQTTEFKQLEHEDSD